MKTQSWKIIGIIGLVLMLVVLLKFSLDMYNIHNENTQIFKNLREMNVGGGMTEEVYNQELLPLYKDTARSNAIVSLIYRVIIVALAAGLGIQYAKFKQKPYGSVTNETDFKKHTK